MEITLWQTILGKLLFEYIMNKQKKPDSLEGILGYGVNVTSQKSLHKTSMKTDSAVFSEFCKFSDDLTLDMVKLLSQGTNFS